MGFCSNGSIVALYFEMTLELCLSLSCMGICKLEKLISKFMFQLICIRLDFMILFMFLIVFLLNHFTACC